MLRTQEFTQATEAYANVNIPPEREAALRRLLDPPIIDDRGRSFGFGNYEYARDSGLIDMFAYEPDKNVDGLMHILAGDITTTPNGATEVGGFHINPDPLYTEETYNTFEDTDHLDGANSKTRKHYIQRPFEPYRAHVTVQGYRKYKSEKDFDGKPVTLPTDNGMFPKEYDALAVMQATRIALETRDPSTDIQLEGKKLVKGTAPMIDGETMMPLLIALDDYDKVLSSYPLPKDSGYMKLSELAIDRALKMS